MASAITHFIVGSALALPAMDSAGIRESMPRWMVPVSCGLMAVLPDLDVYVMRAFDIPYGSFLGHRGFFHSPFFLILLSALLARRSWRLGALWAACAITHPLLDMLTDGGAGVMLLFPFSQERLFFPWHPIRVSPMDVQRFFSRAGNILWSEFPFCLAAIAIGLAGRVLRKRKKQRS